MANVFATQVWFTSVDSAKPTSNFASGQLLYAADTNTWYVANSNTTWIVAISSGSVASGQIGRMHLASGAANSGHIASGAIVGSFISGLLRSIASGTVGPFDLASGTIFAGSGVAVSLAASGITVNVGSGLLVSGMTAPGFWPGSYAAAYNKTNDTGLTTDSYVVIRGLSITAGFGLAWWGGIGNTSGTNNLDAQVVWYDVWNQTETYSLLGVAPGKQVSFNSFTVSGTTVNLGFSSGVIQVKSSTAGNPTGYRIQTTYF